jgi:hypothetical protein
VGIAARALHSGFTVEGIRTPGTASTTVLLLNVLLGSIGATICGLLPAGTAVMAVPFLLRS